MLRFLIVVLLFLPLAAPDAVAQQDRFFVGAWQAEVRDPVRGTAVIKLILSADGSYQRTYAPQAYSGMVYDRGTWRTEPGWLQLRWFEYDVSPQPMYPPPQSGTDTFVVEQAGPDTFRFRTPDCTDPLCWGTMQRVQ